MARAIATRSLGVTRSLLGAFVLALALCAQGPSAHAQHTGGSFGSSSDDWGAARDDEQSSGSDLGGGGRGSDLGGGGGSGADTPWPEAEPRTSAPLPLGFDRHERDEARGPRGPRWRDLRAERGRPVVAEAERAALATPTRPFLPVCCGTWLTVFLFAMSVDLLMRRRARTKQRTSQASVVRISVAFGPEARAAVQGSLREITAAGGAADSRGRFESASRVAAVMRSHFASACYASVAVIHAAPAVGKGELARLSVDLRARYGADTVGRIRAAAPPELVANTRDGPGLVVVSLVLGVRGVVPSPGPPARKEDIQKILRLPASVTDLVGLEVVWSPSEDADRLSSYELEALYPELKRLEDATDVGAVRCSSCGSGFSRELGSCPHCGAPITAR